MARAVVLAGGRGGRMGNPEKCLLPLGGVPLLFRVTGALQWAGFGEIVVATTRGHPGVAWAATTWGLRVIYTPGLGYEADLAFLASRLAPALFVACDLADLAPSHITPLVEKEVMATATSGGKYVGLTWVPGGLDRWTEVEVGSLININTWEDWHMAEEELPPAYPLVVETNGLLPHEQTLGLAELDVISPVAVDVWTCTVLDGHHRLEALRRAGAPAPVLPLDYRVVDVNLGKLEVMWRAAAGLPYPPKSTWHTYRGRHVSHIPTVPVAVGELHRVKPLRCEAI
ncbi:MAG: NTP transferase domain-containing protein [Pyrobaculum sp.]